MSLLEQVLPIVHEIIAKLKDIFKVFAVSLNLAIKLVDTIIKEFGEDRTIDKQVLIIM